ncbi:MAG: Rrf2 family transcriptional regulator [Legionellales bacterium]|jgi:Rrf2 family nitric oxide-sensitive transcriptional repressor
MQLNRQTDYALRALIFLGVQQHLCTIDDIAVRFNIAREHLVKIIGKLAKLNYITATRGKGGGLKLNPETRQVLLSEIVKHFEPTFQPIDCEGLACPLNGVCRLSKILCEASHAFLSTLGKYTLDDILPKTNDEQALIAKKLNIKRECD